MRVKNVCVIGAGTMGGGIASHLANLGIGVTLLDTTVKTAQAGLKRALNAQPPCIYLEDRAAGIRLGGVDEHLAWVSEADWVIEAVYESADVKKALYAQLDPLLAPDTLISTNTSGLPLLELAQGRSPSFRKRFIGTHFFNPPRYLKLLELIPTADTDPEILHSMRELLESQIAKRVVIARDTPGFIANRFGMWSIYAAMHVAEQLQLSVEATDAITGPFIGRPKSGTFRLGDIVGLDVMSAIAQGLIERCPDDPHLSFLQPPKSVMTLLDRGWIGDKSGQGFYRREGREFLALDLTTMAYRPQQEPQLPSLIELAKVPLVERIERALIAKDETGEFLRNYLIPTLQYAEYLRERVSHSAADFDRVMMWGFGWEMGPFALIDALQDSVPRSIARPATPYYQSGNSLGVNHAWVESPIEPEYQGIRDYPEMSRFDGFVTRDLGDSVTAISITTKMGVLSKELIADLTHVIQNHPQGRYVLTSEAKAFSAGFDLEYFNQCIQQNRLEELTLALIDLQQLGELFERTKIVAAIYGHCLGGGLELALSCPTLLAQAETKIGLPEVKVGVIPAGRGTTLMRLNAQSSAKRLAEVAMTLAQGTISTSADHARALGYLRPSDITVYHPDRLITDAKQAALTVKPTMAPEWKSVEGPLAGIIDQALRAGVTSGTLTEYDAVVAERIAHIFAKSTSYEGAITREREEFVSLCEKAFTLARIRHMRETNKPLRN